MDITSYTKERGSVWLPFDLVEARERAAGKGADVFSVWARVWKQGFLVRDDKKFTSAVDFVPPIAIR
ncbi:hypothetical protein M493_14745 [Geobacillus genomosp. 3]|uniref:Uncharacterized protein n=1 Tax=Geobacillus genomosp. 3 TaxID=1921421 RepID=S5Z8P2_GEOG3|nr:hypothetical protein M493_14745 [Geobacillus genomosp. 3]